MSRCPLQVLVFPYIQKAGVFYYALFKRKTGKYWQGIAGGGEMGETPLKAAQRESCEEAGIPESADYMVLLSMTTMPAPAVCGFEWGESVCVVLERSFGVAVADEALVLSQEHCEYKWMTFDEAMAHLKWDSNKNALWELNHRLTHGVSDMSDNLKYLKTFLEYGG
ncbi:MAG: NUDIX domain-containing protein [Lactobacillales bacterium]|nr:NUDIX domain-containing protein [Lactobacillales bacterium]